MFNEPPNLTRILSIYSIIIWILIINSMLLISSMIMLQQYLSGLLHFRILGNNFVNTCYELMRHVLRQPLRSRVNDGFTTILWSMVAFFLTSFFSAGVLDSILHQPVHSIDSIEELIESNMSAITVNSEVT